MRSGTERLSASVLCLAPFTVPGWLQVLQQSLLSGEVVVTLESRKQVESKTAIKDRHLGLGCYCQNSLT